MRRTSEEPRESCSGSPAVLRGESRRLRGPAARPIVTPPPRTDRSLWPRLRTKRNPLPGAALLVAAMAGLLGGCSYFGAREADGEIFVSGRIEGDEIDIASKISGRVAEITVREGDRVKAGQVLARVEGAQQLAIHREALARLAAARTRGEQARLQIAVLEQRIVHVRLLESQAGEEAPGRVAQAEAQLEVARAELSRVTADEQQVREDARRYEELAAKGAVTRQLAEQYATRVKTARAMVAAARKQALAAESAVAVARTALENPRIRAAEAGTIGRQVEEAKAAVRLAEADARAAEAAAERARSDVDELEIRAPADATVITRAVEPGRVVAAGATLMTLVDMSRLYLRGFVPEGRIGLVELAQAAEVVLDSSPAQPIPAEVMRVDPQAMFTPENTYFKEDRVKQVVGVKLLLKGGAGQAKPGMPADARIFVKPRRVEPIGVKPRRGNG